MITGTTSRSRPAGTALTISQIEEIAHTRLLQDPPDPSAAASLLGPSDYDLNPGHEADFVGFTPYRPAAVLVPIVMRQTPHVLLTLRASTLAAHAGQIAFPGGRIDPDDAGPMAAAVREANEEIGLSPSFIKPLGYLDSYRTGTGYVITPVVALVEQGHEITLNVAEVESSFEVPLGFLLDPVNHTIERRMIKGRQRQFHAIPFEGRYIWGATAGIIRNLYERLIGP